MGYIIKVIVDAFEYIINFISGSIGGIMFPSYFSNALTIYDIFNNPGPFVSALMLILFLVYIIIIIMRRGRGFVYCIFSFLRMYLIPGALYEINQYNYSSIHISSIIQVMFACLSILCIIGCTFSCELYVLKPIIKRGDVDKSGKMKETFIKNAKVTLLFYVAFFVFRYLLFKIILVG